MFVVLPNDMRVNMARVSYWHLAEPNEYDLPGVYQVVFYFGRDEDHLMSGGLSKDEAEKIMKYLDSMLGVRQITERTASPTTTVESLNEINKTLAQIDDRLFAIYKYGAGQ